MENIEIKILRNNNPKSFGYGSYDIAVNEEIIMELVNECDLKTITLSDILAVIEDM